MYDLTKQQDRTAKYLEIITELNKQNRQGEDNIFNCGELGFIRIWWRGQWVREWVEISNEFRIKPATKETDV